MALFRRSLPATFTEGRNLTASAERVNPQQANQYRRLSQGWQPSAFAFYRTLGECWYPAQFYAHALPNVRYYAAIRDPQGEVRELDPNDWASEQLARIQDPGGGRSMMMEAYGRLQFLIGDSYLVGSIEDGNDEGWEFLSPSELRAVPGTKDYVRISFPGATPEELASLPDDDFEPLASGVVVYRFWSRDPEYTSLADSPVRAVLPLYEQLALLEAAVTARAKSRVANAGFLLVAQELSFGTPDGQNDDDPNADPFAKMLQLSMTRAIREPGSAAGVAPPVLRVPSELIQNKGAMDLIRVSDPTEPYPEENKIKDLRSRIAIGLDMPPEILLGLADSNHWSGWQIDEQAWNAHLKPVVIRFCDDLARAYLRPIAKAEGHEYTDGELIVWFDPSDVINHPDRSKDFRQAYEDGVIGAEAYRNAIGATDEDAQTQDEHDEWLLVKLRATAQAVELQQNPQVAEGAATAQKIPPSESQAIADNAAGMNASAQLVWRVLGAAELQAERARERAGAKIVTAARKPSGCQECAERVQSTPNSMVASVLGAEQVADLKLTPASLTAGSCDPLRTVLPEWGVPVAVANRIAGLVEKHAAATLFDPTPLPEAVSSYIEKALTLREAA